MAVSDSGPGGEQLTALGPWLELLTRLGGVRKTMTRAAPEMVGYLEAARGCNALFEQLLMWGRS